MFTLLFVPFLLSAQAADTQARPVFEVISIKPTTGQPVNSGFRRSSPGMLNATNVTLRFLIQFAYDIREDQVLGGPSWIDAARYEILAKPGDGGDVRTNAKLLKERTRNLLADRFHLEFHRETRELPVLVLTVAKNGPKGLHPPKGASPDFIENGHHLGAQDLSIAAFARQFLAGQTGRSVIDKTGIDGAFDFTLDWSPDDAPAPGAAAAAPDFPPLFQALQEQLGLKLDRDKGPVEVLLIDRVERPAEN